MEVTPGRFTVRTCTNTVIILNLVFLRREEKRSIKNKEMKIILNKNFVKYLNIIFGFLILLMSIDCYSKMHLREGLYFCK